MNTILLDAADLGSDGTTARLRDARRVDHVRRVLRAAVGDAVRVGVLGARLGTGRITHLDDTAVELMLTLDREPPPPLPLTLVLALPRPKVVRRVLHAIAAFGIPRVILLGAWRVERAYWDSPQLTAAAIRPQLILGLEQAGDTRLPNITLRPRFKPFIEDELPALATDTERLLAHPTAQAPCPRERNAPLTLVIGPEGGFTDYEIDCFTAAGFTPISLGPRVLRVEHALPALLGRLF